MQPTTYRTDRRKFLAAFGAACFATRGVFAEELARTPELTEGPFYPDKLPLDRDNDLIIIGDHTTPALGEITHLTGKVLGPNGSPVKGATIEIWQCDANAVYLHSADSSSKQDTQDRNFQGYGAFTTASDGGYRFRTIKPVPYPGRPAGHIHVKVSRGGKELITTQIFVAGAPGNKQDGIFLDAGDAVDRELVQADFRPVPGSKIGELAASFEIVLGKTPDEVSMRRERTRRWGI